MPKSVSWGWCLKTPKGVIQADTFALTKDNCWSKGFEVVAYCESEEWRRRFWKRWGPSLRSAHRKGWRIVKVELVEIDA